MDEKDLVITDFYVRTGYWSEVLTLVFPKITTGMALPRNEFKGRLHDIVLLLEDVVSEDS